MKRKCTFYCEIAFVIGIITLALGAALMEKANFGLSMVVAPAYLIHLKLSQYLPFYTFGMSEYVLQAVLLLALSLVVGRFKKRYILSFLTALLYGLILDGMMAVVALFPLDGLAWRIVFYVVGMLACTFGVALLFHTYLPPEAYEMVVKEISQKFSFPIDKVKTLYDCLSCLIAIVLSFAFFGFGSFVGVQWGTILCALVNGWLIGRIGRFLEKKFDFQDMLRLRSKFN